MYDDSKVGDLIGVTLASVTGGQGDDEMVFTAVDGRKWKLYHYQGCCESVEIAEVHGDLADLVGAPLVVAEESSSDEAPKPHEWSASWTWTFYRFATERGAVQVRWLGESNGYYSESVSFAEVTQ